MAKIFIEIIYMTKIVIEIKLFLYFYNVIFFFVKFKNNIIIF